MPTMHSNPSDEAPNPLSDYSRLHKEQSTNKPLPAVAQQSESRSTATTGPRRHDSLDSSLHTGERGPRKASSDTLSDVTSTKSTTTTPNNRQRTISLSNDRHKVSVRSGLSNSNREASSDEDSSDSFQDLGDPKNQDQSNIPSSNQGRSTLTRVPLQPSYAQVANASKDSQHPKGATEDTSAKGSAVHHPPARRPQDPSKDPQHPKEATEDTSTKGSATHHPSTRRPQDAQARPEEQQDRTLENKQSTPQVSGYGRGMVESIMSFMPLATASPPPPKDKYQQLKEEYYRVRDENRQLRANVENYDRELRRRQAEYQKANHYLNHFQHENQRSKDTINGLQNELMNIHQQLEDAKNLSEVRGKELFGAQVFLTKADTLSISEVGEKVTALNEEIFQAAATLGEALIHHRYEASQKELEAAVVVTQEMIGEKMAKVLVTQPQISELEPEVNPLLVQVVLQIFMVKFCVSKIQSWFPDDSHIGNFLSALYSEIRLDKEQAVSGRWRALTRAHTRPSTESWKKELYEKLGSVLIIASWKARSSENEESYGNRLPSIFKAINELRTAIGEKITSADLDIFIFECDKIYDPNLMEDAYGDGRQSSGKQAPEAIVGTTGIGLGQVMAERSAKDIIQMQSLIPAKIVLTSTMNEALEPIQPTRRKKKKPVENTDGADQDGRNISNLKASSANMDTTS